MGSLSNFASSGHCKSLAHCRTCRSSSEWRELVGAPEDCPHGVSLPSLPDRVTSASFAGSMVGWAKGGFQVTAEETLAERLAICAACPEWDQAGFFGTGRCQKCGCSTSAKLRMATSTCPLGKW